MAQEATQDAGNLDLWPCTYAERRGICCVGGGGWVGAAAVLMKAGTLHSDVTGTVAVKLRYITQRLRLRLAQWLQQLEIKLGENAATLLLSKPLQNALCCNDNNNHNNHLYTEARRCSFLPGVAASLWKCFYCRYPVFTEARKKLSGAVRGEGNGWRGKQNRTLCSAKIQTKSPQRSLTSGFSADALPHSQLFCKKTNKQEMLSNKQNDRLLFFEHRLFSVSGHDEAPTVSELRERLSLPRERESIWCISPWHVNVARAAFSLRKSCNLARQPTHIILTGRRGGRVSHVTLTMTWNLRQRLPDDDDHCTVTTCFTKGPTAVLPCISVRRW